MFSVCEISADLWGLQAPMRVRAEQDAAMSAARIDGRFVLHMNKLSSGTLAWFGGIAQESCCDELCALNLPIQR